PPGESRAVPRRPGRAVPPRATLGAAQRSRQGLGGSEPEAPDDRMRYAQRKKPAVRRERSGDDAVADIERLVRLSRIERGVAQRCWIAPPVPASIQRSVASSKRRLIA